MMQPPAFQKAPADDEVGALLNQIVKHAERIDGRTYSLRSVRVCKRPCLAAGGLLYWEWSARIGEHTSRWMLSGFATSAEDVLGALLGVLGSRKSHGEG